MSNGPPADLGREARLVVVLARPELSPAELEECWHLVADPRFDAAAFLDLAARHRVAYLIGRHVWAYRLYAVDDGAVRFPHSQLFLAGYVGNRERHRALTAEYGAVLAGLRQAGVPFAVRKGPVLAARFLDDPAVRHMADLDLLIDRQDTVQAGGVLRAKGYRQGHLAPDGRTIQEFSRRTQLFWKVNLNNELAYLKLGTSPEVPAFAIDICTNIFQRGSSADVSVPELLSRAEHISVCGEQALALSVEDEFVDLCAHLYKEATSLYYAQHGDDLVLRKFLDIAIVSRRLNETGWRRVVETTRSCHAEELVYYAIHHTCLVYPDAVPESVLASLRPADCAYLDEYGDLDGTKMRWDRPFLERLFDVRRHSGVPHSVIPTD